jgi:DnaK suppressor protein
MCINKLCRKCAYDEFTGNKTCKWSCEMKNELQQESLRQLLLAQKVQLVEKMKLERGGARSRAEAAVAQLSSLEQSHAQNITERDTAFALQEHDVAEFEAIEHALERMANGNYGLCQDCSAEIPTTRLLAFPSAMRCIGCQSAAEKVAGPDAALH